VPMDLEQKWILLCDGMGLSDARDQWVELSRLHGLPGRAYHNLTHVAECLARLEELASDDLDTIALAIWFHDLVYDSTRDDNESASAGLAREFITNSALAARVSDLIMATRHNSPATDEGMRSICDVDLSILGAPAGRYAEYTAAIQMEYCWVEDRVYREKRAQVLRAFLNRKRIYQTAHFFDRLEHPARANVRCELTELERSGQE
jgi:predicted metal-dependent HD superfamily phosphohydrolase